ncbi:MAG TPA: hypothetical protein DGV23_05150 [Stenotrophomonas sp.]|nr:hypothetical protein [Stenotrophomonas sp.]
MVRGAMQLNILQSHPCKGTATSLAHTRPAVGAGRTQVRVKVLLQGFDVIEPDADQPFHIALEALHRMATVGGYRRTGRRRRRSALG